MASFGAVCAEIDGNEKIDELVGTADRIMYKNKQMSKAVNKNPFVKGEGSGS